MVLVSISVRSKLVLCTDDILELFLLKEGASRPTGRVGI